MEKPVEIRDKEKFLVAAVNEFWDSRPGQYAVLRSFLDRKIKAIELGDLKEDEYVAEWERKFP